MLRIPTVIPLREMRQYPRKPWTSCHPPLRVTQFAALGELWRFSINDRGHFEITKGPESEQARGGEQLERTVGRGWFQGSVCPIHCTPVFGRIHACISGIYVRAAGTDGNSNRTLPEEVSFVPIRNSTAPVFSIINLRTTIVRAISILSRACLQIQRLTHCLVMLISYHYSIKFTLPVPSMDWLRSIFLHSLSHDYNRFISLAVIQSILINYSFYISFFVVEF